MVNIRKALAQRDRLADPNGRRSWFDQSESYSQHCEDPTHAHRGQARLARRRTRRRTA